MCRESSVRLIEMTHLFLLRDACVDSRVSILNFGMARNFGQYQLRLSVASLEQRSTRHCVEVCVTSGYAWYPEKDWTLPEG